ncbi:GntR family transcriptional regulator [Gluconacetobacter azotocaptans]|uniref:GntR family transcriptional regulator n=1 Tax=Gluconacetobacter azotocaptans TaxID=142834 RepID=UPI00195CEF27|nr:GntR family transcriptional regulator [Gluconacetobacter azotocaptans]MBM9400502.1 GntR family transcriptional regulator [Gluconacetobacter azotocaptans]
MLPASIYTHAGAEPRGIASEAVGNALREAILDGLLTEGQALPQSELASGFGVSTIPVREALKQLEAEGLVAFQANRGAMVTGLSEADIIEFSEIRAMLEERAAAQAVARMTRLDLARIEDAYDAFVAGTSDAPDGMARSGPLNWAFHGAIYAAAGRPRLLEMIEALHRRVDRYIRGHLEIAGRKHVTDAEHLALLDACRRRDADAVARLTRQHILDAATISVDVLHRHRAAVG